MRLLLSTLLFIFLISCSNNKNENPEDFNKFNSTQLIGNTYVGTKDVSSCDESEGPEGGCNSGYFTFVNDTQVRYFLPGSDMGFQDEYVISGNKIVIDDPFIDSDTILEILEGGEKLISTQLGTFILSETNE